MGKPTISADIKRMAARLAKAHPGMAPDLALGLARASLDAGTLLLAHNRESEAREAILRAAGALWLAVEPLPDASVAAQAEKPATQALTATREAKALRLASWDAYSGAYAHRYGAEPVRNAKTNGQIAQLVQRLGQEAPAVLRFYLDQTSAWYLQHMHALDYALRDAEKLRTQWATGRVVTESDARHQERTGSRGRVWDELRGTTEGRE